MMLTVEQLTDAEFFALMTGILALALAALLTVIVWPIDAGRSS
jgi:hypothetical protein